MRIQSPDDAPCAFQPRPPRYMRALCHCNVGFGLCYPCSGVVHHQQGSIRACKNGDEMAYDGDDDDDDEVAASLPGNARTLWLL